MHGRIDCHECSFYLTRKITNESMQIQLSLTLTDVLMSIGDVRKSLPECFSVRVALDGHFPATATTRAARIINHTSHN